MYFLKRLIARFAGGGPNRIAPFADVAAFRIDRRQGVHHQPETFDGIVLAEPGDTANYHPGHSLLSQPASSELIFGRRRYLVGGIAPRAEKILYTLTACGVTGTEGIVYCPWTRTAVKETMRTWTRPLAAHPVLAAPRLPEAQQLPDCSLNLALLSAEGFYHFLFESLPRLWLARSQLGAVAHVLVNGAPGSFQEKWLQRAGVMPEKIIWMHGHAHFHCEQLLFTNFLMRDYQPTPWMVQALRQLLNAVPPATPGRRRLWISRSDAQSRQPAWEAALLASLPGFESVTLSQLSPDQQINLMREAAVVAGPHGAGFSNVVFCASGTKVVEIFPDTNRHPIYGRLANVCQLSYAWAVADFSAKPPAELANAITRFVSEARQ